MKESEIGIVAEFDAHRGLGIITSSTGENIPFHCVEIEGGSRTIDQGTPVSFEAREKFSRREAFCIRVRQST